MDTREDVKVTPNLDHSAARLLDIKQESDDGEKIQLGFQKYNMNYTCLGNSQTENEKIMNNSTYKVGDGMGDSLHVTLKLDGHLNQVGCYDGHGNVIGISTFEPNINIKQESGEIEIEKHDYKTKDNGASMSHFNSPSESKYHPKAEWYRCQKCNYRTKSENNLRLHIKSKHDPEAEWHHCQACYYKTNVKKNLARHFRTKHDQPAEWYCCGACPFKTKHKRGLVRHFRIMHDETTEWYQCEACVYKTKYKKSLSLHFRIKHDEAAEWYQCQTCDYKTKNEQLLSEHFLMKHDEEAEWYCQACGYETKCKELLREHYERKHNNHAN